MDIGSFVSPESVEVNATRPATVHGPERLMFTRNVLDQTV